MDNSALLYLIRNLRPRHTGILDWLRQHDLLPNKLRNPQRVRERFGVPSLTSDTNLTDTPLSTSTTLARSTYSWDL